MFNRSALALSCITVFCPAILFADTLSLQHRTTTAVPSSTALDQSGQSFSLGGLSGITYAGGNRFWAVMDNSNKLVALDLTFTANGAIATSSVAGGISLATTSDFEGIAYTNSLRNSVFLSEETTPAVREFNLANGAALQTVSTPAVYATRISNFGFESLSRGAGTMWTANEEALPGDGALSTPSTGTVVRLQKMNVSGNTATAASQYAYNVNPIHRSINDGPRTAGSTSRSGLSDMIVLPSGKLLTLERDFARAGTLDLSSEYQNRIYFVDPTGATDVSGLPGLTGQSYTAATKSLLWSADTSLFSGADIGNLEGLALGPQLANGNWVVLGIVDNNVGDDPLSDNTLVAFELSGDVPEPGCLTLCLAGAIMLRRSRKA
jgi:hypothetical protein